MCGCGRRRCGLNYDEVAYTLKLHGYMLCHRQKPEKASTGFLMVFNGMYLNADGSGRKLLDETVA